MAGDFRSNILKTFHDIKFSSPSELHHHCFSFMHNNSLSARLRPITQSCIDDNNEILLLANWRDSCQHAYLVQFKVTEQGTRNWLRKGVIETDDRILFMVEILYKDNQYHPIGHIGLFRLNPEGKFCEIDNIVRGVSGIAPGIMQSSIQTLLAWKFMTLGFDASYLRVFSNNARAIALYERLGYREIQRTALKKVVEADCTRFIEVHDEPYLEISSYFVTMKLTKETWLKLCK